MTRKTIHVHINALGNHFFMPTLEPIRQLTR